MANRLLQNNSQGTQQKTSGSRLDLLSKVKKQGETQTESTPTLAQKMPGTIETLAELQVDPLSFGENPKYAIENAVRTGIKTFGESIKTGAEQIKNVFTKKESVSETVGDVLEGVSGAATIVFSPITALFEGANEVPVLGTASKLISLPFLVAGEGASNIANELVDVLPIDDKAKDNIRQGTQEIFALASQIALGKVSQVGGKKFAELKKRFGERDATTIIEKATELAEQAKQKVPTKQEIESAIPSRTDNLTTSIQQAKSEGKTFDEWVKGQGETVYHGGTKIDEVGNMRSKWGAFYMTDNPTYAKSYGGNKSVLNEMVIITEAKLADLRSPSANIIKQIDEIISPKATGETLKIKKPDGTFVEVQKTKGGLSNPVHSSADIIQGIKDGKAYYAEMPEVKEALKKLGYDGMITQESKLGANYGVWNKNVIKTRSQLKAEWDATGTTRATDIPQQEIVPVKTVGAEQKVVALTDRVNRIVNDKNVEIAKDIAKERGLDVDVYDTLNKKENKRLASEYIAKNGIDDAISVLERKKDLPQEIAYNSMLLSALSEAEITKNPSALSKLSSIISKRGKESTRAGQELSILADLEPGSVYRAMEDVVRANTKIIENTLKKGETIETKKSEYRSQLELLDKGLQLTVSELKNIMDNIICK